MEAIFYLKMLKTKNDFLSNALCWSITQNPSKAVRGCNMTNSKKNIQGV